MLKHWCRNLHCTKGEIGFSVGAEGGNTEGAEVGNAVGGEMGGGALGAEVGDDNIGAGGRWHCGRCRNGQ